MKLQLIKDIIENIVNESSKPGDVDDELYDLFLQIAPVDDFNGAATLSQYLWDKKTKKELQDADIISTWREFEQRYHPTSRAAAREKSVEGITSLEYIDYVLNEVLYKREDKKRIKQIAQNYADNPASFAWAIQDMSHREYAEYLFEAMQLSLKDGKFFFLFPATARVFTGNSSYGIYSILTFYKVASKMYPSLKDIYSSYLRIFIDLADIINIEDDLKAKFFQEYAANYKRQIDWHKLERLSNELNINPSFWFSPLRKLYANTYSNSEEKKEHLIAKKKFLDGEINKIDSYMMKFHYFKILEATTDSYILARKRPEKHILVSLISILDNFIELLLDDDRFMLDHRLLSLMAARNSIVYFTDFSFGYSSIAKEIEKHIEELDKVIERKNYSFDSIVVGKTIEILAKTQDYINYKRFGISLEDRFIQQLNVLNSVYKIENIFYDSISFHEFLSYSENHCHILNDYGIRQTRYIKLYELGMSFASGCKFVGSVLPDKRTNSYSVARKSVEDYWKTFAEQSYEVEARPNFSFLDYI